MTLLEKIWLSRKFGKATYVVSAILTVMMTVLAIFYPEMITTFIIIKIISIPAIYYLRIVLEKGFTMYFYINLGISRGEYLFIPAAVEFMAFVVLMIIAEVTGYAIG